MPGFVRFEFDSCSFRCVKPPPAILFDAFTSSRVCFVDFWRLRTFGPVDFEIFSSKFGIADNRDHSKDFGGG